jgi:uncharacterized RDD family membrane protein YckC
MEQYLVVINGKPEGPFHVEQLKELGIKPGTFVKTAGMDDYKEAHEIPELCRFLGFQSRIRQPQYFGSLDVRLLAVIIDYFLFFAVYCIVATVVILFIDEQSIRILTSLAGLALIPVAKLVYCIFMEASARQGSYGKQLLGLKVCDEEGAPLSLNRSLVRNFSKLIGVLTIGMGYVSGFFDRRQQCLHDKIAGTLVIKDRLL